MWLLFLRSFWWDISLLLWIILIRIMIGFFLNIIWSCWFFLIILWDGKWWSCWVIFCWIVLMWMWWCGMLVWKRICVFLWIFLRIWVRVFRLKFFMFLRCLLLMKINYLKLLIFWWLIEVSFFGFLVILRVRRRMCNLIRIRFKLWKRLLVWNLRISFSVFFFGFEGV